MCQSGKTQYVSPGEAANAAALILKRASRGNVKSRKRPGTGKLTHYRCPMCSLWHIGHSPKVAP